MWQGTVYDVSSTALIRITSNARLNQWYRLQTIQGGDYSMGDREEYTNNAASPTLTSGPSRAELELEPETMHHYMV